MVMNKIRSQAFSLIELSIILVIIGLLIVSIAVGSRMMEGARLNKLMKETEDFRQSITVFVATFGAYPGDINNAFDFFGSVDGCTDDDVNSVSSGCNGNGNEIINWDKESYRVNQHLSLAELLPGSYNGTSDNYISSYKKGLYQPPFPCSDAGYNKMGVNCHQLGNSSDINGAVLSPLDQYKIDQKLDDGAPKTGDIRFRVVGDVTDATCGSSSGYLIDKTELGCNFLYVVDVL